MSWVAIPVKLFTTFGIDSELSRDVFVRTFPADLDACWIVVEEFMSRNYLHVGYDSYATEEEAIAVAAAKRMGAEI